MRAVAPSVLRHRILPSYHAESEGITPDDIVLEVEDSFGVRLDDRGLAKVETVGYLCALCDAHGFAR